MCECFLIAAANISGGASLSLSPSLTASQLMWLGRPVRLLSLCPTNNKKHFVAGQLQHCLTNICSRSAVWASRAPRCQIHSKTELSADRESTHGSVHTAMTARIPKCTGSLVAECHLCLRAQIVVCANVFHADGEFMLGLMTA